MSCLLLRVCTCTKIIIFFFLNQNICCGYSKEPSQWDGSFEHPKHMLKPMGEKIFIFLLLYPRRWNNSLLKYTKDRGKWRLQTADHTFDSCAKLLTVPFMSGSLNGSTTYTLTDFIHVNATLTFVYIFQKTAICKILSSWVGFFSEFIFQSFYLHDFFLYKNALLSRRRISLATVFLNNLYISQWSLYAPTYNF